MRVKKLFRSRSAELELELSARHRIETCQGRFLNLSNVRYFLNEIKVFVSFLAFLTAFRLAVRFSSTRSLLYVSGGLLLCSYSLWLSWITLSYLFSESPEHSPSSIPVSGISLFTFFTLAVSVLETFNLYHVTPLGGCQSISSFHFWNILDPLPTNTLHWGTRPPCSLSVSMMECN